MKRYCTSCGSPTEFIDKKPLFCSNCGKSFEKVAPVEVKLIKEEPKANFPTKINKITSSKLNRSQRVQRLEEPEYIEDNIDDNDDYEDNITSVPEIDDLEVEAESRPKRGQKLKDIVGTEPNANRESRAVKSGKKPSRKQVLEDFAREAGSIRKTKRS